MWSGKKAADTKNSAITQSPEERRKQLRATAAIVINENKAKLNKLLSAAKVVETSQYYFYGYIMGAMTATMATCLAVGNRIPFFRSSASMISLAGGYFGGSFLHKAHIQYNLQGVAKSVDEQIEELKKMSEKVQGVITDYDDEIDHLSMVKRQLLPNSPEAIQERSEQQAKASLTVDERADLILAAYEKRKSAMSAAAATVKK